MTKAPDLRKIYKFHYSLRATIIPLILALAVSTLIFVLTYNTEFFVLRVPLEEFGLLTSLSLPVFPLPAIVISIRPIFKLLDTAYEISQHHIRAEWGRVSLNRHREEIPFERIHGVRVVQSLIERLLNCGSIVIWTSFVEHPDIVMKGVANPAFYAKVMHDRIDHVELERKVHKQSPTI